ncbi:MAG: alkene reductase, partial [Cyanobacteria bacterium P01_A01_bin.3]
MTVSDSAVPLLSPIQMGPYQLPNRIVMAPLTRNRAGEGNVPHELNATYYHQRSSAGLLITEATQISPQGVGYPRTPGIHSAEQVEGWKLVTDAVHEAGGRIFLQLWHVGRISHPSLQPDRALPVAPSAIAPSTGQAMTYEGMQDYVVPRALKLEEMPGIIQDYRLAAQNALAAGFDGVEVHSANGYLLDQFLRDGTNQRTDRYGGSLENRVRLLQEVTQAVVDVWGSDRVGVRLSPGGTFNDMSDSDTVATFDYVVESLNHFNLAYLHIREADEADLRYGGMFIPASRYRDIFNGLVMTNGGYDRQKGNEAISSGAIDLVAYGQSFIANPD